MEILNAWREAKSQRLSLREFSEAIRLSERTLYYWLNPAESSNTGNKTKNEPPNKLTLEEKKKIIEVLHRPEWASFSPREVYYKLLDEEGVILASVSTFYRMARDRSLLAFRGKASGLGQKLNREKPHLLALAPNEVWSWDVSQIASSHRLQRFYLYVIVDIWSRLVVGWTLEEHEQSLHAIALWKEALQRQHISGQGLVNHKDNGSIMTAEEMIKFVKDARMIDSYSRAGVSDDNPFSESLFRTIKYFRSYPDYFETIAEGRTYFKKYFVDYNEEFRHSGIQFLSPSERHYGQEQKILDERNRLIEKFYQENAHRYSKSPKYFEPIKEVKIN